ncbi:MAG: phage major capsid protein, P2 family, partial [Deltaproteobacteria bacterium]|nr:phage major capsid protein, P2 family [Deltaproteobacteria bacterium]
SFPVPVKTHERLNSLVVDADVTGFLKKINVVTGLKETEGKLLYSDMDERVLKRTNPPTNAREPSIAASQSNRTYKLLSTEADILFSWEKLNAYARFANFRERLLADKALRIANDRLFLGWNGTDDSQAYVQTAAITTLNKGWIQRLRDEKAANVISEIVAGSGKIFVDSQNKEVALNTGEAITDEGGGTVGIPATAHGFKSGAQIVVSGQGVNYDGTHLVLAASTANKIHITKAHTVENVAGGAKATQAPDYKNMDELMVDLVASIPVQKRSGLTAMMADDLRATERGILYNQHAAQPTEKVALERAFAELAGHPVETPAFIPTRTLVATKHRNLSIYVHENLNRKLENKHEWKGLVDWNEWSEGYFVEDLESMIMAENIYRIND